MYSTGKRRNEKQLTGEQSQPFQRSWIFPWGAGIESRTELPQEWNIARVHLMDTIVAPSKYWWSSFSRGCVGGIFFYQLWMLHLSARGKLQGLTFEFHKHIVVIQCLFLLFSSCPSAELDFAVLLTVMFRLSSGKCLPPCQHIPYTESLWCLHLFGTHQ